jgi:cobalt-zinc-cadmium efflux system membrane fusion protein
VIGGNVRSINVFQGDKVKKGQLLAVLEHPDYIVIQEDFAEIAGQLEFLEQEYKRQKELFENNVGSGRDYQKAKSEYLTAKAKLSGLKARLKLLNIPPEQVIKGNITGKARVLSPLDGYVNQVNVRMGAYVDAQDKLFTITDNSAVHADFQVFEKDVYHVKEGQKVHFTVANTPDREYTATVFAVGKEFDPASRAVHIHAKIEQDTEGLIPGMYISGQLHTDTKYVKTVPNDAIVKEGTKSFVFVETEPAEEHGHEHEGEEDEKGHDTDQGHLRSFKLTEVVTGRSDEGYTEIKPVEPLPEDARIVLNAAYYLLADLKKEETEHEH